MKYRLAGASYRMIAEKLTEDRASEYADANGVSVERAMKKVPHVSKRTVWDDVTAELEELRRETEMQRADLMALENARLNQVFSKALSLFANSSVPAGRLATATWTCLCVSTPTITVRALGGVVMRLVTDWPPRIAAPSWSGWADRTVTGRGYSRRLCCNFRAATSGWTTLGKHRTGSPIMPSDNPFKWRQFEPALILSNGASSNPPSSSSAFGGTCGMP